MVDLAKANAEEQRAQADVDIKHMDMQHKQSKDAIELAMKEKDMNHGHAISTIETQIAHRKQKHEESKPVPKKGK